MPPDCPVYRSSFIFRCREGELHKLKHMIRSRWSMALLLSAVFISIFGVFHPYPYDNVQTRWALTRQMVEHGTLSIDPYAEFTADKAHFGDHYYCDKAVLTSVAAGVIHLPVHLLSSVINLPEQLPRYLAERLLIGGSFILLLLALARSGKREGQLEIIPVLALGLGSILLPYSTLLYGHVPAAFLIFLSYCFQKRKKYARADIFGALAAAVEFPTLLLFIILAAYRGRAYWKPSRILRMAGFLIIAFLPQILHNWIAFGNPLTMGYSLEATAAFEGMSHGFFGFTLPTPGSFYLLLISPERGLLFYMPWVVFGFLGFFKNSARAGEVIKNTPLPVMVLAYILLFSSYYMPSGGWAFGPRHLIPILPFLALGLYSFVRGSRSRAFIVLVLIIPAMFQAYLGLFGEVHLPVHPFENPVPLPQWNICANMLMNGHHSVWLADLLIPVIVLLLSLYTLAARFSSSRFTWAGMLWIPLMLILALLSAGRDWGGRIDFYRGILAEHREEYLLASQYYFLSAKDPTAPAIVGEKAIWCFEQASASAIQEKRFPE